MSKSPARSPNPGAARRSAGRLAAVQALYSMEITDDGVAQALEHLRERVEAEPRGGMAQPDLDLATFLITGVAADGAALDRLIGAALTRDWTVDRLEAVLRAILRAGSLELKMRPQTPTRVAISEYVDVAHAFYSGPEPGLVNAVLDKVARAVRPDEFASGGA
jgi:N utilization substance protein B